MWDVMEMIQVIPRYVDVPRCYPWRMTFHTILFTTEKSSFVWVVDRFSLFEAGAYGTVAKITHLNEHHVAYSLWGDAHAMNVADEFDARVKSGRISLAEQRAAIGGLHQLANDFPPPKDAHDPYPANHVLAPRGLLVAHISNEPQVYRLSLTDNPRVSVISGEVSWMNAAMSAAGDPWNPAVSFLDYYGRITPKATIQELLLIGVHMLRVAATTNSRSIREIDAWVCEKGVFRQLSSKQVEVYVEASKSLDNEVLQAFRNAPLLPSS
jgi:hypothetical protein